MPGKDPRVRLPRVDCEQVGVLGPRVRRAPQEVAPDFVVHVARCNWVDCDVLGIDQSHGKLKRGR